MPCVTATTAVRSPTIKHDASPEPQRSSLATNAKPCIDSAVEFPPLPPRQAVSTSSSEAPARAALRQPLVAPAAAAHPVVRPEGLEDLAFEQRVFLPISRSEAEVSSLLDTAVAHVRANAAAQGSAGLLGEPGSVSGTPRMDTYLVPPGRAADSAGLKYRYNKKRQGWDLEIKVLLPEYTRQSDAHDKAELWCKLPSLPLDGTSPKVSVQRVIDWLGQIERAMPKVAADPRMASTLGAVTSTRKAIEAAVPQGERGTRHLREIDVNKNPKRILVAPLRVEVAALTLTPAVEKGVTASSEAVGAVTVNVEALSPRSYREALCPGERVGPTALGNLTQGLARTMAAAAGAPESTLVADGFPAYVGRVPLQSERLAQDGGRCLDVGFNAAGEGFVKLSSTDPTEGIAPLVVPVDRATAQQMLENLSSRVASGQSAARAKEHAPGGKNVEVERRWKLNRQDLPAVAAKAAKHAPLYQAYFIADGTIAMRAREKPGGVFEITIKGPTVGKNGARNEFNLVAPTSLTRDTVEALAAGKVIEKVRYKVPVGEGLIAEVDDFAPMGRADLIAEVEFDGPEKLASFKAPPWLAQAEDITGKAQYNNARFAEERGDAYHVAS